MFLSEEASYIHSPKRRAGNPKSHSESRPIFVDNKKRNSITPPSSPPRSRCLDNYQHNRLVKQMEDDAWCVRQELFPYDGQLQSQLEFLVRYAILAPSIYNSQPWLFRVEGNSIEIFPDTKRSLAIVDPNDRQLRISCGAAFYNLRLAATHFGFEHTTELSPESGAIARITLTKITTDATKESSAFPPSDSFLPSTSQTEHLFQAITARNSDYEDFDPTPISEEEIRTLKSVAEEENGIWFQPLTDPSSRKSAAALISEADLKQSDYIPYRQEVAKWIRAASGNGDGRDGVPCCQFGISSLQYWMGSYLRSGNWLKFSAQSHKKLVENAPLVAVLGSKLDTDREWFVVGQNLQKILLCASHLGLSVSQQNQALELPELRGKLQSVVSQSKDMQDNQLSGLPQVVLRMGYRKNSKPTKHTPRRSLASVLLKPETSPRSSADSAPFGSPHSI
eukprot:TRINITY_DN5754_c0_g1_i1.p1 TRINITY_DN5754_c0_g1~~TRINITY_DN5754_c0_g1_i1.p1  ORF type:complete len:450 (-),score=94.11 TRINITY_DN5754_c0_g1_i1:59-1408(-)